MRKSSGIGGQAVLEGIMMKNKDKYAVAVRKADNEIEVQVNEYKSATEKCKLLNIPFIRGIFNFVDSMVLGIKSLMFSAEFFEEEVEPVEKIGDKVSKKLFKEKAEAFLMGLTVFFSLALSVGLFMVLPYLLSEFIKSTFDIERKSVVALIEGISRIVIFIVYIVLISFMKDIQRTYMYHGAEHKCINCIENGFVLNVENVRISSRKHKRCGTSFLLFVVVISIACFIILSSVLPASFGVLEKVGIRLLCVPFIAGISYEIIRLAGKSDNIVVRIISAPGMALQKLTTKEPTDDMIEVAIKAVEAVFDWKAYLEEGGVNIESQYNAKLLNDNQKKDTKEALEVSENNDENASDDVQKDAQKIKKTRKASNKKDSKKSPKSEDRQRMTMVSSRVSDDAELDEFDKLIEELENHEG